MMLLRCTFYWCRVPGCTLHPESYGRLTPDGQLPPCPCDCHLGSLADGVPATVHATDPPDDRDPSYRTPAAIAAGCDRGGHDYDATGVCEDCRDVR